VAKLVSQAWKDLPDEGRSKWLELGRLDRERYEREKLAYKGPWKIPDVKHPNAPKRPCSAFLAFSNERRRAIVEGNPHLNSTQISSALSKMWKESPEDVKQMYREKEAREREVYKEQRTVWNYRNDLALSEAAGTFEDSCGDFSDSSIDETTSKSATLQENTSVDVDTHDDEANITDRMEFHDAVFGKGESRKCQELGRISAVGSLVSFASAKRNLNNYELFPNGIWSTSDVPRKINLPTRNSFVDFDIPTKGQSTDFSHAMKLVPSETHSIQQDSRKPNSSYKDASRFDNYSMDEILVDDELFEDFCRHKFKKTFLELLKRTFPSARPSTGASPPWVSVFIFLMSKVIGTNDGGESLRSCVILVYV